MIKVNALVVQSNYGFYVAVGCCVARGYSRLKDGLKGFLGAVLLVEIFVEKVDIVVDV